MLTKHSLVERWAIQHYDQFLAFDSSSSFYVQFKEEEFFGQFYHTILQNECSIKRKKIQTFKKTFKDKEFSSPNENQALGIKWTFFQQLLNIFRYLAHFLRSFLFLGDWSFGDANF